MTNKLYERVATKNLSLVVTQVAIECFCGEYTTKKKQWLATIFLSTVSKIVTN